MWMPIGNAASAVGRRLDALRRALLAQIVRILRDLEEDDRGLTASKENLRNAIAVRRQVLDALRDAGVEVVETEVERAAVEVARDVLSYYDSAAVGSFAPRALGTVEAIMRTQVAELPGVWDEAADTIRLAIDRGVVTGAPLEDLIERVQAAIDTSFSRAEAVVNSAIMGALRTLTIEMAESTGDGDIVYLYTGPEDGKTRPFCDQHVGKAFTRAALDRLDSGPGQPKPTSVFLGGYNCRHTLSPITLQDAAEDGIEVVT